MDALERERMRDAELQTQLDNSPVFPYTRSIYVPQIKAPPKLDKFWDRADLARTSGFTLDATPHLASVQTTVYLGCTRDAVWVGFV